MEATFQASVSNQAALSAIAGTLDIGQLEVSNLRAFFSRYSYRSAADAITLQAFWEETGRARPSRAGLLFLERARTRESKFPTSPSAPHAERGADNAPRCAFVNNAAVRGPRVTVGRG
jgi:hypothetical protein